jgi:hypothetical protein
MKITPWIALNGMHVVQGKVVMGIHMYMARFEEQHIG